MRADPGSPTPLTCSDSQIEQDFGRGITARLQGAPRDCQSPEGIPQFYHTTRPGATQDSPEIEPDDFRSSLSRLSVSSDPSC